MHALTAESHGVLRFLEESRKLDLSVSVVSPKEIDIIIPEDSSYQFLINGRPVDPPDFLINRMGSATTYYGLAVMRQMENAGVFVPNSSESVALSRDKMQSLQALSAHGLPVVKSMLAKYPVDVDLVGREFGFPVIIKTLTGSQGRGVYLCETKAQFEDLIAVITASQGNPHFVVQRFIGVSRGRDLRVFVVGDRVVGCMSRVAPPGMFKANFSAGAEVSPFPVSPVIEELALKAARTLGLQIAGIDLLFDNDGYKICEANSSPGFRGFEQCSGINIPLEIFDFIRSRIEKRKFAGTLPERH